MESQELNVAGKVIQRQSDGYLLHREEWNEAIAVAIATVDGIDLNADHWALIHLLRQLHQEHRFIPPLRPFIRAVKSELGSHLGNSMRIHQLFPQSPLKTACRIAGLPRPKHCM